MTSVLLSNTLDELDSGELKSFQWHLRLPGKSFTPLKKSQLEKANREDTVDLLVETFGASAVDVTLEILRTMVKNSVAEDLENKYRASKGTASSSTSSSARPAPTQVTNSARDGGFLFAPQLSGNTVARGLTMTVHHHHAPPR